MNTKALRQKILDLAIHGKLVPQDPNDEPAAKLLDRIRAEKERLAHEGKIKRPKKPTATASADAPWQLPKGWVWTTLGEICSIFGRIGFRGYTKEDLVEEGAITLSPSNIVDGKMDYSKCTYISWAKYEESPEIKIFNGDILLVKTGSSFGKCALVENLPQEATINPQFVVIKYIGCNNAFLSYVLQSPYCRKCYDNFVLGTAIPTFTQVNLSNMQIPLPPLPEQQRIVAEVERLNGLVDVIEQNQGELNATIAKAKAKILDLAIHGKLVPQNPSDEPASALLTRINPNWHPSSTNPFPIPTSWQWTILGELFAHNTGKALNSSNTQGELHSYITTSNLYWDYFVLDNLKQMRFTESELEKCTVQKGDLLVCEGGDVGRSNIWIEDTPICIQNHIHRLRPFDNSIVVKFYYYVLMFNKIKNLIGGKGIGLMGLSSGALHKIEVPLPPLAEQQRIVEAIEAAFAALDAIQAQIKA